MTLRLRVIHHHIVLPSLAPPPTGPVPGPKYKKFKLVSKRKTSIITITKRVGVSKKRKIVTENPMVIEDPVQNKVPMNVNEEADEDLVVSEDLLKKKNLKLPTPLNQKRPTTDTRDSPNSPVSLRPLRYSKCNGFR